MISEYIIVYIYIYNYTYLPGIDGNGGGNISSEVPKKPRLKRRLRAQDLRLYRGPTGPKGPAGPQGLLRHGRLVDQ